MIRVAQPSLLGLLIATAAAMTDEPLPVSALDEFTAGMVGIAISPDQTSGWIFETRCPGQAKKERGFEGYNVTVVLPNGEQMQVR